MLPVRNVLDAAIAAMLLRIRISRWIATALRARIVRISVVTCLGVIGLGLAWWWYAPLHTAHQALAALRVGDRATFETFARPDSLLTDFFDEWVQATLERPSDGVPPRAVSLSVKPEVLASLRQRYVDEFSAIGSARGWLLDGVTLTIEGVSHWAVRERVVRVTVRTVQGRARPVWLRLRLERSGWRIVGARNLLPAARLLLETHPALATPTPAEVARAARRARQTAAVRQSRMPQRTPRAQAPRG